MNKDSSLMLVVVITCLQFQLRLKVDFSNL
jgi:hypothetical protein